MHRGLARGWSCLLKCHLFCSLEVKTQHIFENKPHLNTVVQLVYLYKRRDWLPPEHTHPSGFFFCILEHPYACFLSSQTMAYNERTFSSYPPCLLDFLDGGWCLCHRGNSTSVMSLSCSSYIYIPGRGKLSVSLCERSQSRSMWKSVF